MKRSVLELIDSFRLGGSERQAVQLSRHLHAEGSYRIFVGCLDRTGDLINEIDWLSLADIPQFKLNSFRDANFLRQAVNCARFIRGNQISVVHTHDFYTNIFGMFSAFLAGVPARIASKRETFSKSTSQMLIERQAFRLAHRIVANADAVSRFLSSTGVSESKIVTIHNGLDLERTRPSGRTRAEVLNSIGIPQTEGVRLVTIVANLRSEVKNHRMFLKAAAEVVSDVEHVRFVIAGEGELTSSLKGFADELGIAGQTHFVGPVKNVPDLLAASDVCVLASRSEGFANSIIEYMAAGKPVVVTRVGGAEEAVIEGETGFLVPSDDATAMAERIRFLLLNPEIAASFGSRARQVAQERFSSTTQLANTLEVYESVLAGRVRQEARV